MEFRAEETERLDRLLRSQRLSPWLSRQAWEKALEDGRVRLNGRLARRGGEVVSAGTLIQVDFPALGLLPDQEPAVLCWADPKLRIAVFEKPPGIASYPLFPWERGTLANRIARFVEEQSWMSAEEFVLLGQPPVLEGGLLQRLDKDTSGLVTAAFSREAKASFRKVFSGQVRKGYLAIVGGGEPPKGEVRLYFSPAGAAKMRALSQPKEGAEEARLELRLLSSKDTFSLVEVFTSQGLRHVVRAGLAALGHPLVGDVLYGGSSAVSFHQLHAHFLQIPELTEISSRPPQSFLDCLASLGLDWMG
jgi:23S rRNA pseudouridine1911/1915/1917 synthase